MASTNKTTNYELSQYVGSDKPTYLGDYNSDMLKIDTQMKANNDLATSANATATTANETAGTALTNANNAQSTANSANTTATSALSKATTNEAIIGKFNLNNITSYSSSDMISSNGNVNPVSSLTIATNNNGSVAKIYGTIITFPTVSGNQTITIRGTNLRPTENISINGNLLIWSGDNLYSNTINVSTNGDVTFVYGASTNVNNKLIIINSLLFMSNFGDTPIE